MSESSLCWDPLRKEINRRGLHYTRIENSADPGTPDLNIHFPYVVPILAKDVWVEMKYAAGSKIHHNSWKISLGLRKEQYIWLLEGARAGRYCFLLARIGDGWYLWKDESSWRMAKGSVKWGELKLSALSFADPEAVLDYLAIL